MDSLKPVTPDYVVIDEESAKILYALGNRMTKLERIALRKWRIAIMIYGIDARLAYCDDDGLNKQLLDNLDIGMVVVSVQDNGITAARSLGDDSFRLVRVDNNGRFVTTEDTN